MLVFIVLKSREHTILGVGQFYEMKWSLMKMLPSACNERKASKFFVLILYFYIIFSLFVYFKHQQLIPLTSSLKATHPYHTEQIHICNSSQ